jgi:hypothetical protein
VSVVLSIVTNDRYGINLRRLEMFDKSVAISYANRLVASGDAIKVIIENGFNDKIVIGGKNG